MSRLASSDRAMLALHRWVGLVGGAMICIAAGTAIALNHQDWLLTPTHAGPAKTPYERYLLSVAVDPRDASHLLAGTSDGLFRSADAGKTWEDVVLPVPAEQVVGLAQDASHPGVVYAAFRAIGLYRSEDGGQVWEEVPLPFEATTNAIQALSLSPAGPVLLTPAGLYRQAGGQWAHTPAPALPHEADARSVIKLVYNLHDGTQWGAWAHLITDAVSAALLFLVLTGYIVFFWRLVRVRRARARTART